MFWICLIGSNPGTLFYYLSAQNDDFLEETTSLVKAEIIDMEEMINTNYFNTFNFGSIKRVKAIKGYDAQKDDEISFTRNEITSSAGSCHKYQGLKRLTTRACQLWESVACSTLKPTKT